MRVGGATLAKGLADGTLRRADIMGEYLAAIEAREGEIQAFAHFDADRFLAAPGVAGRLAGLPVGIKDIIDTADMPTECGSPIYRGRMPSSDAPIVAMVKRAGGTIAGKTVTTEFAAVTPGATRNPHNPAHTPGGSSSGSAAAVAAGFVPFSIGTQTGGSIIRPAAFCGVAGFKPTFGLLPGFRVKGFSWTLDTVGLFAASVRDVAFFAEALTGQALATPDATPAAPRFGIARMAVWDEVDAAMAAAIAAARDRAAAHGASIVELAVDPVFEAAHRAHYVIQDYELARSLAFEMDHHADLVSPGLLAMVAGGMAIPTERYVAAMEHGRLGRLAADRLFGDAEMLLAPSASTAAPVGIGATGSPNLTRLWTLLGAPSVNVPGLLDADGMPLGIQVIGRIGQDRQTLRAAAWLEGAIKGAAGEGRLGG